MQARRAGARLQTSRAEARLLAAALAGRQCPLPSLAPHARPAHLRAQRGRQALSGQRGEAQLDVQAAQAARKLDQLLA